MTPLVDLFHYDWKVDDPAEHRRWTGVDNRRIRENLDQLLDHRARIILRAPIIPGVNDTPSHEAALRRWEAHPGIAAVERLPYHDTGKAKYADLGYICSL